MMITRTAHAKLNITLEIKGVREDGFHELDMIFLEIGIGDEITMGKTAGKITLSCSDPSLPADASNLAWKAAALMQETYGIPDGVRIHIEKKTPSQAGLGGGSSDAACVLNAMNELFGLNAKPADLEGLAGRLGSDVPFFIRGGCRRARGRGEILLESFSFPPCSILVVKPDLSVSTPWAYKAYDEMCLSEQKKESATDAAAEAMKRNDYAGLCAALKNDLELPVLNEYPELRDLKEQIRLAGADASLMTGSGSAVFGLFSSEEKAGLAKNSLRQWGMTFLV